MTAPRRDKPVLRFRVRDSITGRFVKLAEAVKRPATTIREKLGGKR
ncbi:hypothetical protein [Mycobacterium sp.]|nr:hypothetical protein [Mycobacterium sp.]